MLHRLTLQEIKQFSSTKNISILDAGCGTGGLLYALQREGYHQLKGFDISADALDFARKRNIADVVFGDLRAMPFAGEQFDVVISHDTLTMFPFDEARSIASELLLKVKTGGILIFNLPAFRAFSGSHDLAVGIQQRYNKLLVDQLLSPYKPVKHRFWPFILSPMIGVVRTWQRQTMKRANYDDLRSDVAMPGNGVNSICDLLCRAEASFPFAPFGSSIMTVVRSN
jgi:SAM-dependent methyltransferase